MRGLFLEIVNMSISAGWLILAVFVIRLILKNAPKWIHVLLWGIVAIRLVCPFTIESPVSMVPKSVSNGEIVSEWTDDYVGEIRIIHEESKYYNAALEAGRVPLSDGEGSYYVVTGGDQLSEPSTVGDDIIPKLARLWIVGMILMTGYTCLSYLKLQNKIQTAVRYRSNIFQSEHVSSPFVMGIIRPRIYIPFHLEKEELKYVIAHEKAHISRKDHWWKPLGFLLLTVHWFNPLIWLAYVSLCKDIELACDEKVIKLLSNGERADYTQALVTCSLNQQIITACPLAFGEIGVKERVKSIMNYKKPTFWVMILSVVSCVVFCACFLTNPKQENSISEIRNDTEQNEQATELPETNEVLMDFAYHLELSTLGKTYTDMDEDKESQILKEYEKLLEGYEFMARESDDGESAYIVGYYSEAVEASKLYDIYSGFYGIGEGAERQLLYDAKDSEQVEVALAEQREPEMGYWIEDSTITILNRGQYILIEPNDVDVTLTGAACRYLYSKNGREYIKDAVSRGININNAMGPQLCIYLISEKYGEIAEYIPLTEEQVQTILNDERVMLEDGFEFEATLYTEDNSEYISHKTGIPRSVLELAVTRCGYEFARPADITGEIIEAKLECDWLEEVRYADDLKRLGVILKNAQQGYVGACGYGAKLTLTLKDGQTLTLFKGTDNCDTIVFGSYGGYFLGDTENSEFWEIFGLDNEGHVPLDAPYTARNQMKIIAENMAMWTEELEYADEVYKYAITDLDENGRYEIIVSNMGGTGLYTYSRFFEVNETYDGLNECSTDFIEGDSQPDFIANHWMAYIDEDGQYHYVVQDSLRNGAAEYYGNIRGLVLENGQIKTERIANMSVIYIDGAENASYMDANGNPLTKETYESAADNYYVNCPKVEIRLGWQDVRELRDEKDEMTAQLEASQKIFRGIVQ